MNRAAADTMSEIPGFDRVTGPAHASRSEVLGTNGMAATSQPLATGAALDILKAGGSAVDAAIAANAVLGLVEPVACGVGGDLFAMVWDAGRRELVGLNASGRSPASLSLQKLRSLAGDSIPAFGPLPVSVPGAVDGWFALHGRYGRLPMPRVLAPAIGYADDGFPVTEVIAAEWAHNAPLLARYPGFPDTFMPGGSAPAAGQLFANPRLARTYRRIAGGGRDAFYAGDIAREIEACMVAQGGFLSCADLAAHRSEWVTPVAANYRGVDVWELPPNGQGVVALQILKILEGFDLAAMGFGSADHVHTVVEAKKLAFEDRARYYADPAFAAAPIDALISGDYAARRRALIDPRRAARSVAAGDAAPGHGDTTCLAVADRDGNMVSLIQSNYIGMGSGMTPGDLGFVLQNRGKLFALADGHANVYAPGKRPFHTIIPAFLFRDGKPWVAFGLMGGGMQPQGHAQIVVNLVDFGMNLQAAGDAARIRHDGSSTPTGSVMTDGGTVALESAIREDTRAALRARGHHVDTAAPGMGGFGGFQAVMVDAHGVYHGASESRKDGHAAGY